MAAAPEHARAYAGAATDQGPGRSFLPDVVSFHPVPAPPAHHGTAAPCTDGLPGRCIVPLFPHPPPTPIETNMVLQRRCSEMRKPAFVNPRLLSWLRGSEWLLRQGVKTLFNQEKSWGHHVNSLRFSLNPFWLQKETMLPQIPGRNG